MTTQKTWTLDPHRCFSAEPSQRQLARHLFNQVEMLPLICPHGHVSPRLLADPEATLGTPADLFVIPDHYVIRMLYSQGVSLEALGLPTSDGPPVETDHREIWRRFAENFHLFRSTPTGLWLKDELIRVFEIDKPLSPEYADVIYDELVERTSNPAYSPRVLFKRFNIEVLCTTDGATDSLDSHRSLHAEDWTYVRPTFRPDAVVNIGAEGWRTKIEQLGELVDHDIGNYQSFVKALEARRTVFKGLGAVATDHAAETPYFERLSEHEVETLFGRALNGSATKDDTARFTAHMLLEFARMSTEDGLIMQLHAGSLRNYNRALYARFGADQGADIPLRTEWTRSLQALLNTYGNDPAFRLVLFTLDESTYGRELAPLAGHYPALRLGPPWWFFDSVKGIERFLDAVVETAGIYNLAGFNDDTRAFASIPARHDVWRRVTCNWLAGEAIKGLVDEGEAADMAYELAYGLAKSVYKLGEPHRV